MRHISRLLVLAALAPALALATPALAQTQDNSAVAENTKDGKSVFKLAFSVKKVTAPSATPWPGPSSSSTAMARSSTSPKKARPASMTSSSNSTP